MELSGALAGEPGVGEHAVGLFFHIEIERDAAGDDQRAAPLHIVAHETELADRESLHAGQDHRRAIFNLERGQFDELQRPQFLRFRQELFDLHVDAVGVAEVFIVADHADGA